MDDLEFDDPFAPPPFPFDDFGPPPGGGRGGPMQQQETKLVAEFDANRDGWLNNDERKAARAKLANTSSGRRFPGPPGGRGMFGNQVKPSPGRKLAPADTTSHPGAPLYDPFTVRTLFLEFENADWEKELADFKYTDVEVPARLTIDGKTYSDVGVHFHGMSSYMMVGEGQKRSMVLTLDLVNRNQQLEGYRKLNLLNSHEDASLLHSVLALQIAREFGVPAPKANWVRVVINGECWGLYVNQQHFNKDFVRDNFGTTKGPRWKVPGNPGVHETFVYLGETIAPYKNIYEIKSRDADDSWKDLIRLCKVLNQTPPAQLEAALEPILDVDGVLRFLAWDSALANGDGFWTRTSDIDIYEDKTGRFHIIPYDANECFSIRSGGPGGPPPGMRGNSRGGRGGFGRPGFGPPGGGPGAGGGVTLDPLVAAADVNKPLYTKLLAVPALRERYLRYVRELNDRWLTWDRIGPIATQYHNLIDADVKADTRKLESYEEFEASLAGGQSSIKAFVEKRHEYLAKYKPAASDPNTTHSIARKISEGNER